MKRKCYFYNCGTIFDKNNRETLFDCWNCNPNCCKSDLCNGLWCEDYGIYFDKQVTEKFIQEYVKKGIESTYGYMKEIEIDLPENLWDEIEDDLVNNYDFTDALKIKKYGFIPYDFSEIIEDYSSYWEQPDISYFKKDYNTILKNVIDIKLENELDKNTINWLNTTIYKTTNDKEMEMV